MNDAINSLLDLNILISLQKLFIDGGVVCGKPDTVTEAGFREALAVYIGDEEIEAIYPRIDINDDGFVEWTEFTNFLIVAEANSAQSEAQNSYRLSTLHNQEGSWASSFVHSDFILFMCFAMKPFQMLITGGRDGLVKLWNPANLHLIASIVHQGKNDVFLEEFQKNMSTSERSLVLLRTDAKRAVRSKKPVSITGMCVMNLALPHLCVASADGSLTVYDLVSKEVCGRLTDFEDNMPTVVDAFIGAHRHCYITIGDSVGNVYFMRMDNEFGSTNDTGAKKKNQLLFTHSKTKISRLPVHTNWVTKAKFISDIDLVATAGMDGQICLVDYKKCVVMRTFSGHNKCAVQSLDWCQMGKYVCSASERKVLMWDPFTLDVVFTLDGFTAPIVDICICDETEQLILTGSDKILRIYHNITYEAGEVAVDHCDQRPQNKLTCACYAPPLRHFFTAGNRVSSWSVERWLCDINRGEEAPVIDNDDDACTILFNSLFDEILCISRNGTVDVYNAKDNGRITSFIIVPDNLEPTSAHPIPTTLNGLKKRSIRKKSRAPKKTSLAESLGLSSANRHQSQSVGVGAVSAMDASLNASMASEGMVASATKVKSKVSSANEIDAETGLEIPLVAIACFDKFQRRLIVVTRYQSVQLFNFNCGECLEIFQPSLPICKYGYFLGPQFLSSLTFEHVLVGERKFERKLLLTGSDSGCIFGILDDNGTIFPEPAVTLVRPESSYASSSGTVFPGSELDDMTMSTEKLSLVTNSTVSSTKRQGRGSKVLWMRCLAESKLLAAYDDGALIMWSLENDNTWKLLSTSATEPSVSCMHIHRNVGIKSSTDRANPAVAVVADADAPDAPEVRPPISPRSSNARSSIRNSIRKVMTINTALNINNSGPKRRTSSLMDGSYLESMGEEEEEYEEDDDEYHQYKHRHHSSHSTDTSCSDLSSLSAACDNFAAKPPNTNKYNAPLGSSPARFTRFENRMSLRGGSLSVEKPALGLSSPIPTLQNQALASSLAASADNGTVFSTADINIPPLTPPLLPAMCPNPLGSVRPPQKAVSVAAHTNTHTDTPKNPMPGSPSLALTAISQMTEDTNPALTSVFSPRSPRGIATEKSTFVDHDADIPESFHKRDSVLPVDTETEITSAFESRNVVTCVAQIKQQMNVLIGGCRDQQIRFWEVPECKLLCSCPYVAKEDSGSLIPSDPHDAMTVMAIKHETEDILTAGYESGVIRVWKITLQSLIIMQKNNQARQFESEQAVQKRKKGNKSMVVSPLSLMFEWKAHDAPMTTLHFMLLSVDPSAIVVEEPKKHHVHHHHHHHHHRVSRSDRPATEVSDAIESDVSEDTESSDSESSYSSNSSSSSSENESTMASSGIASKRNSSQNDPNNPASLLGAALDILHDGYLVSSGKDQRTYVWTVKGDLVGRVGGPQWQLHNKKTWGKGHDGREAEAKAALALFLSLSSADQAWVPDRSMSSMHSIYHIHRYMDYDVEHDLCAFKPYASYYNRDGSFNYHHQQFSDIQRSSSMRGGSIEQQKESQLLRLQQAVDGKRKEGAVSAMINAKTHETYSRYSKVKKLQQVQPLMPLREKMHAAEDAKNRYEHQIYSTPTQAQNAELHSVLRTHPVTQVASPALKKGPQKGYDLMRYMTEQESNPIRSPKYVTHVTGDTSTMTKPALFRHIFGNRTGHIEHRTGAHGHSPHVPKRQANLPKR